jgi:hypothetical protein
VFAFVRATVVHETGCSTLQQVHHGSLRPFSDAGFVHGRTEMREPPSGLPRANQPMDVAALHADISTATSIPTASSVADRLVGTRRPLV